MFKHILLPTDGSELSNKAVKEAIDVARVHGAKITAMNVVGEYHLHGKHKGLGMPNLPDLERQLEASEAACAKEILDAVKQSASEAGVECNAVTPISDAPYEAIIKQAEKSGCDLIVMLLTAAKVCKRCCLAARRSRCLRTRRFPCWCAASLIPLYYAVPLFALAGEPTGART
jgi:nucleotide-binding universal stress UspA family protein